MFDTRHIFHIALAVAALFIGFRIGNSALVKVGVPTAV